MTARFDLGDRVAVVTGGSRGLGRAISWGLARSGADVVIASRKLDACRALAEEIGEETGRRILPLACHVGRWDDCEALVETVYERFGRVDILVNNAGMSPTYGSLTDVTEELYDKVLAVNLKGPFHLGTRIGARMARDGGGAIVNVSSVAAVEPAGDALPYSAAKAGLNNLTVGLARSLAPDVRVNAVMPGPFRTDVVSGWDPQAFEQVMRRRVPMQRAGEPDEIVAAVLYLVSDASSYTTGAVIKIDGGTAAPPA